MLHLDDDISSSICRANWIYRVKETNPDKLTKGWLVLYKNGLLEFKDDQSHDWIFLGNGNVKILINGTRQELLFSDQKLENGFAIVVAEKKYFFKCDSMQEKFFWLIDLGLIIRQITAKDGNDALNDVFDTDAIYDAQHQLKYVLFCCLLVYWIYPLTYQRLMVTGSSHLPHGRWNKEQALQNVSPSSIEMFFFAAQRVELSSRVELNASNGDVSVLFLLQVSDAKSNVENHFAPDIAPNVSLICGSGCASFVVTLLAREIQQAAGVRLLDVSALTDSKQYFTDFGLSFLDCISFLPRLVLVFVV
ncbi:hypothetical protein T4E_12080 [Trichinella pseudospiralis]|uniref:PH domain-containing protein n=1 Tax=Trichinella pseudospiralis TaxID=6337 RepID=A0A0V0XF41_TRIPS|nr:hypothetical protein T4E_12080 [Trichinella pseudospiralis]